jgi:hypothetical protein
VSAHIQGLGVRDSVWRNVAALGFVLISFNIPLKQPAQISFWQEIHLA